MPHHGMFRSLAHLAAGLRRSRDTPPYYPSETPFPVSQPAESRSRGPVFVTARFRTGSTLLWQVFNSSEDFTAYYEPLNERRWFLPDHRGGHVDQSHRGVQDYTANYDGLEALDRFFTDRWTTEKLYLGEAYKAPALEQYISALIDRARSRPLLQFNRVDFRLPFLRGRFPEATIIHLRRNPRDTWRSTLRNQGNDQSWTLLSFAPFCRFYLLEWYRDLVLAFPNLLRHPEKTHPYEIHYLIQRLSDLFARKHADVFLSYEKLEMDFVNTVNGLMALLGANEIDNTALQALFSPRVQRYDHGPDADFYAALEAKVEQDLSDWLTAP